MDRQVKPIHGAQAFWEESVTGDPLWEEWVLGQEVLDCLDKPLPDSNKHELWVMVARDISPLNMPLLHKIAASVGFGPSDLFIKVLDIHGIAPRSALFDFPYTGKQKVLFLGVSMPAVPAGEHPPWVAAPDLDALARDENARKLLWAQIKGWRNDHQY